MFSILVNTTDSFEDCWYPFFKLFKKYWPDFHGTIYLNTETKDFSFEGLDIVPIKNKLVGESWSKCLKFALNFIEEEIILYLQDDYFLKDTVQKNIIEHLYSKILENNIDCIHLTPFASEGPFEKSQYLDVLKYSKKAAYKIGTQASLWRKSTMKKYLKDHENAWHFEVFGTKRAWRHNEEIYIYNFNKNENEIIPYSPTGIVKGKWKKDAVFELFAINEIDINYNIRGFYNPQKNKYKTPFSIKKIIDRIKSTI